MQINSRYEVQERLGQGGMGEVFRAYDHLTGHTVALKRVSIEAAETDSHAMDTRRALAQEFQVLARLRHPHIVSVLDYGFDDERQPFLVMELVPGARPITAAMQAHDTGVRAGFIIEMLLALAYLHRRGVLHRDLKPDNVLVDAEDTVRVLDFGLAIEQKENVEGVVIGTLRYMAPEILQEQSGTIRTDLYAVGVMMYEIFSGQFPYNEETITHLILDIMQETPDTTMLPRNLGSLIDRLLAKLPSERPADANEVIEQLYEALDLTPPVDDGRVRQSFLEASVFIGREQERAQLLAVVDAISAAQPAPHPDAYWLIGGESGVGKSRLVDEVRIHALVRGMTVLNGQAVSEGGLPYQVWRDVVRRLVLAVPIDDHQGAILREIAPDIEKLLGRALPPLPRLTGKAGRDRLILAIVDLLRTYNQPTLIILEDLQWAFESLQPLQQLLSVQAQLPHVMVVATFRVDERPDLPQQLPAMGFLRLGRLSAQETQQLSSAMLGSVENQGELNELILRETEGNVFFMIEVMRALAEEAGSLSAIGKQTLPQQVFAGGVQNIISRRLSRTPAWGRTLLVLAATAGRTLDLSLLEHLLVRGVASLDGHTIQAWLTACGEAAVLEAVGTDWRFAHDKLREALLSGLTPEAKAQQHRHVARAIETLYPDDKDLTPVLLRHWQAGGDVERERLYILDVAEQEVTHDNVDQRRVLYQRAITIIPEADRKAIARAYYGLGRTFMQYSDFDEAREHFQATLDRTEPDNYERLVLTYIALSQAAQEQADVAEAISFADESELYAEKLTDGLLLANVYRHKAGTLIHMKQDFDEAEVYLQRALRLADQHDDLGEKSNAIHELGAIALFKQDRARAIELLHQTLEIAYEINSIRRVAVAQGNLGLLCWEEARLDEAETYLQQALDSTRRLGNRWSLANITNTLGYVSVDKNDAVTARKYFAEALAVAQAIGAISLVLDVIAGYARLDLKRGEAQAAAEVLGMIRAHAAYNANLKHTIAPMIAEAKAAHGDATVEAWLTAGAALDVDAVITRLIS